MQAWFPFRCKKHTTAHGADPRQVYSSVWYGIHLHANDGGEVTSQSATAHTAGVTWQEATYQLLKEQHGVTQFTYVPDAGHKKIIELSQNDTSVHSITLTTEEEGVAVLAGADLGHQRGVLLLQSSGVGNCINFLSFVGVAKFPILMLVSMRGDFGEANPWQFPMGRAVEPVLHAMGVTTFRANDPDEVTSIVDAASTMVFQGGESVAVLLTQRLLGAKKFV